MTEQFNNEISQCDVYKTSPALNTANTSVGGTSPLTLQQQVELVQNELQLLSKG